MSNKFSKINFFVFGQIKNLWIDKIASIKDICIKFKETELVETSYQLPCV